MARHGTGPPTGPRDRRIEPTARTTNEHRPTGLPRRERDPGGHDATHPRTATAHADHSSAPADASGHLVTGTTVVALRAEDGVVLAADRRASHAAGFTANKDVRKVERVHPTAALAFSGAVGPAQDLADQLRAEASLYESRRGEPMSMRALSQAAGALTRGRRVVPLLGGVDESGGHVYEIDPGGGVLADGYAAAGSGTQLAYGALEGAYEPDSTIDAAAEHARAAVAAATERDTASGDGLTVATVTAEGVEFLVEDELVIEDEIAGLDGGAS